MVDIKSISFGLRLSADGIWESSDDHHLSYPSDGNENCFAVEENSFWFKHRNDCIASVVKSFPPENNGAIFDIGGGNGFVSIGLANEGYEVVLVEPGRSGASNAKSRGLKYVICATTNSAKFKPYSLPAVGLFDVIEHIEDDISFLKSLRCIMKKGGRLYITVPSYPFLWSADDILSGHFRRYTLAHICNITRAAGFHIEFSSYFFRILPIPIFLLRALPYKLGLSKVLRKAGNRSRDHAVKSSAIAHILSRILHPETEMLENKIRMRFGGSCVLVARCLDT